MGQINNDLAHEDDNDKDYDDDISKHININFSLIRKNIRELAYGIN